MSDYVKAAIGTLFLAMTLGAMGEVMIWGGLSMLHANSMVILSGEALGAIALLVVAVPVFQLILRNERSYGHGPMTGEPEISVTPKKRQQEPKPTAFV